LYHHNVTCAATVVHKINTSSDIFLVRLAIILNDRAALFMRIKPTI